jgi:membrane protease YdiL (CAAX protease family)
VYKNIKLAHLRHLLDKQSESLNKNLIIRVLFQSFYTTFFGLYASYIYIKGGSLIGPVVLHMMCNTLQFPRFNYLKNEKIGRKEKKFINYIYISGILGFWIIIMLI